MSLPSTVLVDTRVTAMAAPAAAMALYQRLVALDAIERLPHGQSPCFALRAGFASMVLDPAIVAVEIRVREHRWLADAAHGAALVEGGGEHGLFAADAVQVLCPACGFELDLGGEYSESLEQALDVWTGSAESAYVACPECETWTALQDWPSPDHGFAAGNLGIVLRGAHLTALTAEFPDTAARLLRTALGDPTGAFRVVYATG
jgi:hypothetical protein